MELFLLLIICNYVILFMLLSIGMILGEFPFRIKRDFFVSFIPFSFIYFLIRWIYYEYKRLMR